MAEAQEQIPEKTGLVAPTTTVHNKSGIPIFLIPIYWVDGPDPQSHSVVRKDLVKEIPAGGFNSVDSHEYDPDGNTPASQIRILFRAGHTNNDEEFLGNLKAEPEEELYSPHYLFKKGDRYFSCNKEGQVIEVDKNSLPISGMEFFRNAQAVRLRNCHGQFLVADDDEETVALRSRDEEEKTDRRPQAYLEDKMTRGRDRPLSEKEMRRLRPQIEDSRQRRDNSRWWYVEFVSDSVLHLKSCHNKYLTASELSSLDDMTGCQVLQSPHSAPDFSFDLEPVKAGNQVKLRTHYDTFLCANSRRPYESDLVTHDLYPSTAIILWDVEVAERVEGTAANIDDKASEEGSTSDIDDKASFPTKRRYETGEGSSVTKSPSGVSGLIREGDGVRYRRHFWELKRRLVDNSGRKDLLVWGESGTTALVRDVCADVWEHFATIAWISIPQENDNALIREEILVQLIFERVAFCWKFNKKPWMLEEHQFPSQQEARCLIVVDNLDDLKTWERFERILLKVKTCRVICIARSKMGSSYSQMEKHRNKFEKHGRQCEIYELEGLSYLPPAHHLKNFLEKGFPSPSKGFDQLIVAKCQRLPRAIVFILRDREALLASHTRDEWEAWIPSDNLADEFHVIQQLLETLYEGLHTDQGHDELDPIQQVWKILFNDDGGLCLSYLSIFPEDRPLSCKTVSLLWVAEGFLPDVGRAELFLKDLLMRKCIIPEEKSSDGRLSTFRVDERVRKIIVSLSDLGDPVTITSLGSTRWPRKVRFLSIQGTIRDFKGEKFFKFSSIFMPDVFSNEDKTTTLETLRRKDLPRAAYQRAIRAIITGYLSSFSSMLTPDVSSDEDTWEALKHSKVLYLTGASFQIVPDELFKLTNARYLSLRNTSTKVIPSSIKNLTQLEFLDAKHSLVTKLPQQVARLKKIRHILIYHHKKDPVMGNYNLIGFKASCRVGGLECLEKLCFVEADKRTLEDLGNLTKLRRLGITKLRKEHGELLCNSLGQLEKLESLNVHALDENEILNLHCLFSPPKSLERLYLHGRLEKLPDWISSHDGLTRIILRWSQLKEDLLATLGKLRNLVELKLHRAYDGERLDFKDGQFPTLKILLLEELEGLRSVSFEQGTLLHLENLTISRCLWLERIPSGIEHIHSIQKLSFFDVSCEFYKMRQADHEKYHYRNFRLKPEVTEWKAGLHDHKKQLIKLLLEDNAITTDVLVQGGLGMTALVRNVCEDVHTREHFDTIVWITLPQEHDSELIREEILLQILFQNAPFPNDFDADHRVFRYFTNSSESNEARCLIVVDNLVDPRIQKTFEEVLHLVKTYKVIFMARREMDPSYSPNNGRLCETYKLEDLSVEEPWAHFRLKKSPEEDFPSPLKEVCQPVLGKIKSLPEAIVLHLRSRKERNDEWAPMILSSDKLPSDKLPSDSLPKFNLIQRVLEILSNDRRPFCLLYLSNFPENRELSCNSVYRLWAAERFLSNLGEAKGFFKVLLDRKCIHAAKRRSDGELSTFRVDNLVREIITPFSRHWKITSELSKEVSDHTGEACQIIPDADFNKKDVRCLILRDSLINKIQGSIGNLKHLQFLDAKQSLVTELPPEVESLQNIRQILIYHHEKQPLMMESSDLIGFKASCNLGELQCLEKLCFVESDNSTLEHLANLKKLRRLGITKLTGEHAKSLCTCLEKLKQLESLNVHACYEDELLNLDHPSSSPPVSLKRLYLHGRLGKLPNWISSLYQLTKIVLRWSRLKAATQEEEDLLAALGNLPNLVELELRRAYKGRQLDFKGGQFPKLKILLLDELGRLRSISLAEGTMPHILDLTISRCPWLEGIPTGIEHIIRTLKELEFFDMSREFYEMVPDDYRNSKGELKIHFTHWRPGQWKTIPLGIGNSDECFAGEH